MKRFPHDIDRSPFFGIAASDFDELPPMTKKRLVRLLAQISEASYRRGVQQALVLASKGAIDMAPDQLASWRRGPISRSRGIDTPGAISTLERFRQQYGAIGGAGSRTLKQAIEPKRTA